MALSKINGIIWCGKKKNQRGVVKEDVTITNVKKGFSIAFRNDTFKHFPSGTILIGLAENAVLIKDGGKAGIKITPLGENPNSRITRWSDSKDLEGIKKFYGDYELKYSRENDCYYVTTEEEDD